MATKGQEESKKAPQVLAACMGCKKGIMSDQIEAAHRVRKDRWVCGECYAAEKIRNYWAS